MIAHAAHGTPNHYPATTLCGKTRKRKSRIQLPLACRRCLALLIAELDESRPGPRFG